MLKAAQTQLNNAQQRYIANIDKAIWCTPQFFPGEYVHLDQPPKKMHDVEEITTKVLPHSTGPYGVLKSHGHTHTIDRDGL